MSRPDSNLLERSLAQLTIGVQQSQARRKQALRDGQTGEWEQQVHVPLGGAAGNQWGYADQAVIFELPFLYAPLQRTVPFEVPHFTHGIEFTQPTSSLVLIQAHLTSWHYTEENWITGATVRFSALAPLVSSVVVPYAATAHLTFEGYSTMPEGDEFQ